MSSVEVAIANAFAEGKSLPEIEEQFDVSRLTVTNILKQQGVVSAQVREQLDNESKDALIIGLRELVDLLERELSRTKTQLEAERKAARNRGGRAAG